MVLVDGAGTPIGALLESASPAEVRLAEKVEPAIAGHPQLWQTKHTTATVSGDSVFRKALNRSFRKERPIREQHIKVTESCAGTAIAGKSSAPSHGLDGAEGLWCDGSG